MVVSTSAPGQCAHRRLQSKKCTRDKGRHSDGHHRGDHSDVRDMELGGLSHMGSGGGLEFTKSRADECTDAESDTYGS